METEDNVLTREELLAQGYVDIRNRFGSVYYVDTLGEVLAKICAKCSELKEACAFNKKVRGVGGKESICRKCSAQKAKNWRGLNEDYVSEKNEKYKESRIKSSANWRSNNHERILEYLREWRASNPDKKRLSDNVRRARKVSLPSDFTSEEQSMVLSHFEGCSITRHSDIHWDHVIPLATGHGGTTYGNMIPLRASLNTSKSDRHIFEWFESNCDRFSLSKTKFDVLVSYLAEVNDMTVKEYRAYVDWCFDNPRTLDELNSEVS